MTAGPTSVATGGDALGAGGKKLMLRPVAESSTAKLEP